jgi:hypothetical protein
MTISHCLDWSFDGFGDGLGESWTVRRPDTAGTVVGLSASSGALAVNRSGCPDDISAVGLPISFGTNKYDQVTAKRNLAGYSVSALGS